MKQTLWTRWCTPVLGAAALLTASGCDAGKEPMRKAAEAEAAGDFAGASTLYEEVCTKRSPLCDAARKRQSRLSIKSAWKAVADGKYKDAKPIAEAAAKSADPVTAEAAAAVLANPDLVSGLAFEDALAVTDKAAQVKAMEEVARQNSVVAAQAKEWLDKNRPAILLAAAKAACVPKGQGSCAGTVKRLAEAHPESPEAKEAKELAAANYKRLYPKIKDVENLLIQRLSVHDKDGKMEVCKKYGGNDETCGEMVTVQAPGLDYLTKFFDEKLALVDDPYYRGQFEKRWSASAIGEYDAELWPKP